MINIILYFVLLYYQLNAKSIECLAEPHIFSLFLNLFNKFTSTHVRSFIYLSILSYNSYLSKKHFFMCLLESFLKASNEYLNRCILVEIRKARGVEKSCLTCPTWSSFHSGQLDISIYLSWDKHKESKCYSAFQIQFGLNLQAICKTVWILIRKPADLDLYCFHLSLYLISYRFQKKLTFGISKIKAKLSCFCIICPLGQVKFSLDGYIVTIYLSPGK